MARMSKFQAIQTLARAHQHERRASDASLKPMEKRYHEGQAKIEREALAMHGWLVVRSHGIECDVKRSK